MPAIDWDRVAAIPATDIENKGSSFRITVDVGATMRATRAALDSVDRKPIKGRAGEKAEAEAKPKQSISGSSSA